MKSANVIRINSATLGTSIAATLLYFVPISERVKAVGVLLMTGLATLGAGIAVGGNSGTFLTSFVVLGLGMLYFDPVILIGYTSIYLVICLITYLINSVYLLGRGIDSFMGIVMLFAYAVMAAGLTVATFYGKRLLDSSKEEEKNTQEQAKIMEQQKEAAHHNSMALLEKVESSGEIVNELFTQANFANDNIKLVKQSEEETVAVFKDLMNKMNHSTEWIEENYKLIDQLTENFNSALEKVTESKDFSGRAEDSLNTILSTIGHAHEIIKKSSEETKKIESIIGDINDIASQTNLLAINAAIEAARVGERGTGFHIVSEQIRTLSVQSKQASENIKKILTVLTDALNTTNEKVSNGMKAMKFGIENLNTMIQCIENIDESSNQSKESLNQEVKVFEEIKEEFARMVREVEQSRNLAQTNLENLEVVVQSIDSQTNRTTQMSEKLGSMKELTNELMEQF